MNRRALVNRVLLIAAAVVWTLLISDICTKLHSQVAPDPCLSKEPHIQVFKTLPLGNVEILYWKKGEPVDKRNFTTLGYTTMVHECWVLTKPMYEAMGGKIPWNEGVCIQLRRNGAGYLYTEGCN